MATLAYVLKKTDGSLVTAQEAYDAYMNGTVILLTPTNMIVSVVGIIWCDNNGETADQNNVGCVQYYTFDGLVNVGDESLLSA